MMPSFSDIKDIVRTIMESATWSHAFALAVGFVSGMLFARVNPKKTGKLHDALKKLKEKYLP